MEYDNNIMKKTIRDLLKAKKSKSSSEPSVKLLQVRIPAELYRETKKHLAIQEVTWTDMVIACFTQFNAEFKEKK